MGPICMLVWSTSNPHFPPWLCFCSKFLALQSRPTGHIIAPGMSRPISFMPHDTILQHPGLRLSTKVNAILFEMTGSYQCTQWLSPPLRSGSGPKEAECLIRKQRKSFEFQTYPGRISKTDTKEGRKKEKKKCPSSCIPHEKNQGDSEFPATEGQKYRWSIVKCAPFHSKEIKPLS